MGNTYRIRDIDVEIEGVTQTYRFIGYNEEDFPSFNGQCVYIFADFNPNYGYTYKKIGNTADFKGTFPKTGAKEWLKKCNSNIILIYMCSDIDDELEIERAIRYKENIPYN